MGLENPKIVDAIGIDRGRSQAVLTILDSWDWDDARAHLAALSDKLNHYLGFVESGEVRSAYPRVQGLESSIEIVFRFEPPPQVNEFLHHAESVAAAYRLGLRWRTSPAPNGPANDKAGAPNRQSPAE